MCYWKTPFAVAIAVVGVGCFIYAADPSKPLSPPPAQKQQKQPETRIKADDLCSGNCIIVGRLGKPYGEVSKIRAVWKANEEFKGTDVFLHIVEIDGASVAAEHPIAFAHWDVKWLKGKGRGVGPKQGDVYEGRIYESGGYDRQPEKVDAILGVQPYQYRGFGFRSFLHVID